MNMMKIEEMKKRIVNVYENTNKFNTIGYISK